MLNWILVSLSVVGVVGRGLQQDTGGVCEEYDLSSCQYYDCLGQSSDRTDCQFQHELRGIDAPKCRYPYMVSLQQVSESSGNFQHFCGGVLLDKNLILTAAHCLWNAKEDNRVEDSYVGTLKQGIKVVYGSYCRHGEGAGRVDAEKFFIHTDYQAATGPLTGNDLAIVKVAQEMSGYGDTPTVRRDHWRYTQYIADMTYTQYTILGWGFMSFDEAASPSRFRETVAPLQMGRVKLIDIDTCNTIIQSVYGQVTVDKERMICAQHENMDTCKGDSGGPLIYEDDLLSPYHDLLVGLTSWGVERYCEGLGFPGVYSNISYYNDWIEKTMTSAYLNAGDAAGSQWFAQENHLTGNNNVIPEKCFEEKDPGYCDAALERWYYDSEEKYCREFYYGGCLGNENNFKDQKQCNNTCVRQ
eukprot:TRINITY_DN26546_c1_g1_i4.p1 TRINITY_DN26546_c1_g1~~TRINITY_DN26546_c1_g1_i4.p1  ORF type:complete len:413 (+),score=43.24 TRINITY_DN26546_c1_g1_i4:76-1314(+)